MNRNEFSLGNGVRKEDPIYRGCHHRRDDRHAADGAESRQALGIVEFFFSSSWCCSSSRWQWVFIAVTAPRQPTLDEVEMDMHRGRWTKLKLAVASLFAFTATAAFAGQVTMFEGPAFQGDSSSTIVAIPNFGSTRLEDGVPRSARVNQGTWEACTASRFRGHCVRLVPGSYATLSQDLDGKVMSIQEIGDSDVAGMRTLTAGPAAGCVQSIAGGRQPERGTDRGRRGQTPVVINAGATPVGRSRDRQVVSAAPQVVAVVPRRPYAAGRCRCAASRERAGRDGGCRAGRTRGALPVSEFRWAVGRGRPRAGPGPGLGALQLSGHFVARRVGTLAGMFPHRVPGRLPGLRPGRLPRAERAAGAGRVFGSPGRLVLAGRRQDMLRHAARRHPRSARMTSSSASACSGVPWKRISPRSMT